MSEARASVDGSSFILPRAPSRRVWDLEWQCVGLAPPEAVTAATAAYLEAEDAVTAWVKERCEEDASATALSTALFSSWKDFVEKAGEPLGSQKKLSQRLEGLRPLRQAVARSPPSELSIDNSRRANAS